LYIDVVNVVTHLLQFPERNFGLLVQVGAADLLFVEQLARFGRGVNVVAVACAVSVVAVTSAVNIVAVTPSVNIVAVTASINVITVSCAVSVVTMTRAVNIVAVAVSFYAIE
jgi:hypothetical protein